MADTVVNTLYPPLLETFQPAFLYNTGAIITFSLSPFNSINDITNIHVSVVDQRNNTNVLKTVLNYTQQEQIGTEEKIDYYVGITNGILIAEIPNFDQESIYKQKKGIFQYDPIHDLYAITLLPKWLSDNDYWNNNQYYQVQIRFDKNNNNWHSNTATFASYMLDNREYFSEWSSVTLIKPILNPVLSIAQLNSTETKYTYPGSFHISGNIIFEKPKSGQNGLTYPETEHLQSYRIIVTQNDNIIIDSDWLYSRQNVSNENTTAIDYLLDFTNNHEGDHLIITLICKTNNGYVFNQEYSLILRSYNDILKNIKWNNVDDLTDNDIYINQEDGIAHICFSASKKDNSWLKANIYFKRACSKDNFQKWDLIYQCNYINTPENIEISFDDYTIGSLYKYIYSAQVCIIDQQEEWSEIYWSNEIYPKFYEMLLMRKNKQIAIRYNGQISSWKPTVNRQKIDTLGGRYPKFVENATMNYKTYQISGLISAEEDFNRKFLSELEDINVQNYDIEFDTEYLIRNDTAADGEILYAQKNLPENADGTKKGKQLYKQENGFSGELNNQHDSYPHNHWYWEREFREQLVAWLNDGEPKLYRSMPEGNIAVMLTDINLTPDSQLGRMLYNFSATMYEVGNGYVLDELKQLGIIDIPSLNSIYITSMDTDDDGDDEIIGTLYTKTKQFTLSSDTNLKNWISGTSNYHNTNNIWEDMSLLEQLNEYYTNQNNKVNSSSIKLNDINIDFITPPHYYTYDTKNGFQLSWNSKLEQEIETEWLGYVIRVSTNDDGSDMRQIFVNQKGFYHIPSDSNIKNIQILNGKADIVTQCQYRVVPDTSNKTLSQPIFQKTIVGQYTADALPLHTDIIPLILQNYEKIEYKGSLLSSRVSLNNCKGFLLDVTPYTCIQYKEKDDNETYTLTVGQTGIFNAFEDWALDSLMILGRRMVQLTKYPYDIRDWEYYIDDNNSNLYNSYADVINPQYNTVYKINGQDKIYYIDGKWYSINITNNIAEVPIYGIINYHGDIVKESI